MFQFYFTFLIDSLLLSKGSSQFTFNSSSWKIMPYFFFFPQSFLPFHIKELFENRVLWLLSIQYSLQLLGIYSFSFYTHILPSTAMYFMEALQQSISYLSLQWKISQSVTPHFFSRPGNLVPPVYSPSFPKQPPLHCLGPPSFLRMVNITKQVNVKM